MDIIKRIYIIRNRYGNTVVRKNRSHPRFDFVSCHVEHKAVVRNFIHRKDSIRDPK